MPISVALLLVLLFPGLPSGELASGTARGAARVVGAASSTSDSGASAAAPGPVREALRDGRYPWYDSDADRVRPVWPVRISWTKWLGDRVQNILDAIGRFLKRLFGSVPAVGVRGDWLGMILLLTALATFFVFLLVLWLRRDPTAGSAARAGLHGPGTAALLAQLPEGLRSGLDDPWAEAQRRRLSGDLAGAIVCLFAHQLITLDQMGLIRLAPGWTGRHYVRWLKDPVLVDSLRATLGLFEEVYYGRRMPAAESFESVWSRAQAFQERQSVLVGSR